MSHPPPGDPLDRRAFIRRTAAAGVVLGPLAPLISACRPSGEPDGERIELGPEEFEARYHEALRRADAAGPPRRELRLVAAPMDVAISAGRARTTWAYSGQYPGPEIRLREGERVRVAVENRLPDPTTVHWHGLPVPNAMDGVRGVTQPAIPPEEAFVYDFVAEPAGTYMYHSHVGLQLDRGLIGPLVIEERELHVAYDREYTLLLDDWLPGAPTPPAGRPGDGMENMMGRMRGMMEGGRGRMEGANAEAPGRERMAQEGGMSLSDPARPDYAALLVNGRAPHDPPTFEVRRGERVRLRLANPASATAFRFSIAGHRLTVTHADGRPVEPVTVDSLTIGMGERYDVVVETDEPGAWTMAAASLLGSPEPARAVLRYVDAVRPAPSEGERPAGLSAGRRLAPGDLVSTEVEPGRAAPADRHFDLTLSWGMMMNPDRWTIDGRQYPDAPPLEIREGERVRVSMLNRSPIHHPMHLHGHFFRVGDALKETVLVPGHMGRVAFDFVADNPGDWLFHCHNLYHLEGGMARVFRYA